MRNWIRQIFALILLVPFLLSTSGFVLYNSYCSCTGNSESSIFFAPETCSLHNNQTEEEHECSFCHSSQCKAHGDDFQCDSVFVKYAKLDIKVVAVAAISLNDIAAVDLALWNVEQELLAGSLPEYTVSLYIEPPPKILSHNDFLNFICQLKIPEIA